MGMRWDPLLAAATARELDRTLHRARGRALLFDTDARRVVFFLRDYTLVLELHPLRGWISLLPDREPLPQARPLPVQVRSVQAIPDESALVFALPRVRGKDEGVELVAEMVGNRWNALVIGHRSRIIRHVLLAREDRNRSLTVGTPYEPPLNSGRSGRAGEMSEAEWERITAGAPGGGEDLERTILKGVAWTSSLNVSECTGPDGLTRWREMVNPDRWGAHLLQTPRGPQPYPIAPIGVDSRPAGTLLEAFSRGREDDEETGPAHELLIPSGLVARAEERVRKAEGKARGLRRQLEEARDPAPLRSLGDLILARYAEIPRGRDRATLIDFGGEEIEVRLEPTLPPQENAARYYDEAARIERAQDLLPERIERAEAEAGELGRLLEAVRGGHLPPERLEERLGPAPAEGSGKGRSSPGKRLPYLRFTSTGGREIRVGRGARTNDDLTFRHSAPDDIWLHARQAPGAHVILRWGHEDNPPRRDLVEAAVLAALHSEARHSGSVPVDWTRRKYVRKPRKAPPGAVVPDRVSTLFVEPDPELPERLRSES